MTIPILLILLTIVFLILRVMPGDPAIAMLGGTGVPPERLEEARVELAEELGFDEPLYLQYFHYLGNIFRGDFGISSRTFNPVFEDIWGKFPATIELALFAILIAGLIGILSGTFAATHRGRAEDHAIRIFGIGVFSMPIFWLGLILQLIFCVYLGLFPIGGRIDPIIGLDFEEVTGFYVLDSIITGNFHALANVLWHLLLPSFTLGLVLSGVIARMARANMVDVLEEDYVVAAHARGLPRRRVIFRYGLRNALIPIVTVIGLQFALLLGGAVLTEHVFNWPGVATYLLQGVGNRDFNVIQGAIVFIALFIALVSLIVDVIYSFLDPRIRY